MIKHLRFLMILCLCIGCTSTPAVYKSSKDQLDAGVTFSQVIENPDAYKGKIVYWGGTIVATTNMKTGTQIEVLQKPLTSAQKPENSEHSGGRFLIISPQYLDPAIYSPGRDIVAAGKISDSKTQTLGQMEYKYPVIMAQDLQLIKTESSACPLPMPSLGIGFGLGKFW